MRDRRASTSPTTPTSKETTTMQKTPMEETREVVTHFFTNNKMMGRVLKGIFLAVLGLLSLQFVRAIFVTYVEPGEILVRQVNVGGTGIEERDFGQGYALAIPGMHTTYRLDGKYFYMNYSNFIEHGEEYDPLDIRTQDNNRIVVDISIPVRIIPGQAWQIVDAGLHIGDRYKERAHTTAQGVMNDMLATLSSEDWYNVRRRLEVQEAATQALNEAFAGFHLETADTIYIRMFNFRPEYEEQLRTIQLRQQEALLDAAQRDLAVRQQQLDNYNNETDALVNQRTAWWNTHLAVLGRGYRVGITEDIRDDFFDTLVAVSMVNDRDELAEREIEPGTEEEAAYMAELRAGLEARYVEDENYILGIEGVQADMNRQVGAIQGRTNALSERYQAEADRLIAEIEQEGQGRINDLLSSSGGRALVGLEWADNLTFDTETMLFNSSDGLPFILDSAGMSRSLMGLRQ